MPCYHPLVAFRTEAGAIVFRASAGCVPLSLPCGQCIGCRLERSRQWAIRCMHEAQMHENNSFVTLTYDEDHLPADMSLNYRDFQLFMKRLRKAHGSLRFYMCGEYGETYGRPHYHAAFFGFRPDDLYAWRKSGAGFQLYRSPLLEKLWAKGSVEVGDVTFESAAYIARYVMKKRTGADAENHYEAVIAETGEIVKRVPEFTRMSLKPGIGALWYDRYKSEVYPRDRVVVRGYECKPPRYYDLRLEAEREEAFASVRSKRLARLCEQPLSEFMDDRIKAKEVVAKARIKTLKRSL